MGTLAERSTLPPGPLLTRSEWGHMGVGEGILNKTFLYISKTSCLNSESNDDFPRGFVNHRHHFMVESRVEGL